MAQSFRTMLLKPKALHLLRSAASPRNAGCVVVAMAFMAAAAAQVPDSNAIMGFETPNGWIVRGVFTTTATSTTIRTQGNDALAVKDGFLLTTRRVPAVQDIAIEFDRDLIAIFLHLFWNDGCR
jgi:hypothetical protein